MGKIDLIKDRCIGCGACMSIAPDNFTFGDDGRAEMINSELTNEAIEASEMCPVSAITIEENCDCSNCECDNCESTKEEKCICGEVCNCTEDNSCGCISKCTCNDNCTCESECNCGCKK